MVIRCDAVMDVGRTLLKWPLSCEVRAGGGGCEHGRLANPGHGSGDGQGVWHSFDDNDVHVPAHGVVGWPVEPGRPVGPVLAGHDRVTAVDGAQVGTVWAGVVALDMGAAWTEVKRVLGVERVLAALGPLVPVGGRAPIPLMGLPGLPQFVGIFGVSGRRFAWSGACGGR
jgi:hypothetical protein